MLGASVSSPWRLYPDASNAGVRGDAIFRMQSLWSQPFIALPFPSLGFASTSQAHWIPASHSHNRCEAKATFPHLPEH